MEITVQKLEKLNNDALSIAQHYYGIISSLNHLYLTEREIQLVAFAAVRGSVSYATVREEFCERYNSSFPTINNIVSKLKKMHIFVKVGKHTVVNPALSLDFTKPLVLQITLNFAKNGETPEHATQRVPDEETELEINGARKDN